MSEEVSSKDSKSRRRFLNAIVGIGTGVSILSLGAAALIVRYFARPRLTSKQQEEMEQQRLDRLTETAQQQRLEVEREASQYILVAGIDELDATQGKYFIDYQMRPAMAFKGDDGLPLLISAKCTHLGCTVGNQVDDKGQILCPCHVSYFDVKTGQPTPGSPAKKPLPLLGWVLKDKSGKVLVDHSPGGKTSGAVKPETLAGSSVYIVRSQAEEA